jgi:hypothetical protein
VTFLAEAVGQSKKKNMRLNLVIVEMLKSCYLGREISEQENG